MYSAEEGRYKIPKQIGGEKKKMKSLMKISPIVLAAVLVFTMFVAPAVADRTVIGDTIYSTAPSVKLWRSDSRGSNL